jgi:hypothetical protein
LSSKYPAVVSEALNFTFSSVNSLLAKVDGPVFCIASFAPEVAKESNACSISNSESFSSRPVWILEIVLF